MAAKKSSRKSGRRKYGKAAGKTVKRAMRRRKRAPARSVGGSALRVTRFADSASYRADSSVVFR